MTTSAEAPQTALHSGLNATIQGWRDDASLAPFLSAMTAIVAPLGAGPSVGAALRYHPVFGEIKLARVADDPSLPQGEWVKSRKKADWGKVQALCQRALSDSGKDYQVGAWLCEGWFHVAGMSGLRAGVMAMRALVSLYWQHGFPEIAADDCDARFNVFEWLDEAVARLLRNHLSLCPPLAVSVTSDDGEDAARSRGASLDLTPQRWHEVIAGKASPGVPDAATWRAKIDPARIDSLHALHAVVMSFAEQWQALRAALDVSAATYADGATQVQIPSLRQGERAIEVALQAMQGVIDGRPASRNVSSTETSGDGLSEGGAMAGARSDAQGATPDDGDGDGAAASGRNATGFASGAAHHGGRLAWTRIDAYRALTEIAAFLRREEPHSPVPYLIEKAVGWENAPLDQIMSEVFRSDASMRQYAALLGIALEGALP